MLGTTLKWDITGKCNLQCKHCLVGDGYYSNRHMKKELTVEQKELIIEKLPPVITHINLLGGEPTLAKSDLLRVIRSCVKKNIKITFNTNGLLLNEDLIEDVITAGANGIVLSIDGPTARGHDAIRGGGTFKRIMTNIETLSKYISRNKVPFEVTVNTVLNRYNQFNIEQMIDLCIRLNIDKWNLLQLSITGSAERNVDQLVLSAQEHVDVTKRIAKHLSARSQEIGKLTVDPQYTYPCVTNYVHHTYGWKLPRPKHCCGAATVFGFIDPYGSLYPCDRVAYEFSELKMGEASLSHNNLLDHDFYEIWNSDYFRNMFAFLTNKSAYTKYDPCSHCVYLAKGLCVPCPLYGLRNKTVMLKQCLLSRTKPDDCGSESVRPSTSNLFFFNQYAPKREEIRRSIGHYMRDDICPKHIDGLRTNFVDDDQMIFNPYTNEFFTLNHAGKLVWNLIDGKKNLGEIIRALRSQNIVISMEDTGALIGTLHDKKLILLSDETLSSDK